MFRIRTLTIEKFRAIKRGTSVEFDPGLNVVLGRNATGKTTLLRLIEMAFRSNFEAIRGEEFDLEYTLGYEEFEIHVELKNKPIFGGKAAIQKELPPAFETTGRIRLEADGRTVAIFTLHGGNCAILNADEEEIAAPRAGWHPFTDGFLFDALVQYDGAPLAGRRLAVDSLNLMGVRLLDEALGDFSLLHTLTVVGMAYRGAEEGEPPSYFFPSNTDGSPIGDALNALELTPDGVEPTLQLSHEQVPFLREFVRIAGFSRADLRLRLDGQDTESVTYSQADILFTLSDGSRLSSKHLSFGQKRLLSILFRAVDNLPFIADELTNGLHHAWIKACMSFLYGRQVFVTSPNPILFDHLQFSSAAEVRSRFVKCGSETERGVHVLCWSRFSEKQARRFMDAYDAGMQHVGEILRTEGLW